MEKDRKGYFVWVTVLKKQEKWGKEERDRDR